MSVLLGGLAGGLCQGALPPVCWSLLVSLLCLVVGAVNLKPPYPIPDELTLFGLSAGLVRPLDQLALPLAGFLVCGIWFLLLERLGQIGRGCTKWAAVLGLLLGLPLGFLTSFLAFMLGALLALPLLLLKRDVHTPVPFGVFLSLAGLITTWTGPALLKWLEL